LHFPQKKTAQPLRVVWQHAGGLEQFGW
jgi:hypothetical protein